MKISVFYNHVCEAARQRNISEKAVLAAIKAEGMEAVELGFGEYDSREKLREKLAEAGMAVSSIYRFFSFEKGCDEQAIDELVAEAIFFESPNIMAIPGFIPKGESREEVSKRMLVPMRELINRASAAGIRVLIEDFDASDSPTADAKGMRWFADRLPELGMTFDCGNFYFTGENELDAFSLLKDRIVHVHCKDRAKKPFDGEKPSKRLNGELMYPSPFGDGIIPSQDIFKLLKGIDYNGYLVAEHFDASDQMSFMIRSAQNIKDLLKA